MAIQYGTFVALAGNYIGLSINGGTSASWTVTQVRAKAHW